METVEKTIDDINYSVVQFTYPKAFKLLARIRQVYAVPLTKVLKGLFAGGEASGFEAIAEMDIDLSAIADSVVSALQDLEGKIDPDQEFELIEEILEKVHIDGIAMTKEKRLTHFAGKIGHLYKVAWFVLEANYSDFLGGIMAAGQKALAATGEKKPKEESEESSPSLSG